MQLFDMELERMIREGTITMSDGMAYSTNRQNLLLSLSDFGGGDAGSFAKPEAARNEFIA